MGYLETKHSDTLYATFRVGVGLLFFMYGLQKMFGFWSNGPVPSMSIYWFAGIAELLIGLSLFTGVFVRLASMFGIVEMFVAYLKGHALANGSWIPAVNMGQPAVLFLFAFIATLAYGAKKCSLEIKIFGKEIF